MSEEEGKTKPNLEVVRPGENDITEVREKHPLPEDDAGRIQFRDELVGILDKVELSDDLKLKLQMFIRMHHMEMLTRKSYENSLHNRELVFTSFNKALPSLILDQLILKDTPDLTQMESDRRFIESNDTNMANYQRIFDECDKVRSTLIDMITKATEHFNRSCETLMQIERISKDETKSEFDRVAQGQVLLQDMIDLHKGAMGTARRWF